jgi:sulfite dehydrogenase (cytochrome) subunit B
MKFVSWLPLCAAAALTAAAADSWKLPAETAKFKPGRGAPLAIANCSACHSADYISTQPPLPRPAWKATVEKMRLRYGAPINTNSTDEIVEYLTREYGRN